MNKDLQERIKIAIDSLVEDINCYLEKLQNNKDALIKLVNTLKRWANPQSNYPTGLDKQELNKNFLNIRSVLEKPKKLLPQEKTITPDDEIIIRDWVRIKLNKIADEIISAYGLQEEFDKLIQCNQDAIDQWWYQKPIAEQQSIQCQYEQLTQTQQDELKKYTLERKQTVYVSVIDPFPFYFDYYWMCHYHTHLTCCLYDPIFLASFHTHHTLHGIAHVIGGGMHHGGGIHASHCIACPDLPEECLPVVGGIGLLALASSGLVGGLYALKKTYNSITNFFTGNKMLRSLFRLGGIAGGGYGGFILGGMVGGTLGSMVPGIGTAAGIIIGMAFGAGLGAGIGALITKYTAKVISWLYYADEINPTNPEKYKLTKKQQGILQERGFNLFQIDNILRAIKNEKNEIGLIGSIPFVSERKKKNELNHLLKLVKAGKLEGKVKIGNQEFDPYLQPPYKTFSPSTATTMARTGGPAGYNHVGTNTDLLLVSPKPSAPPNDGELCNTREYRLSQEQAIDFFIDNHKKLRKG